MTRPKPPKDFMTQGEVAARMGISLAKFRTLREDLIEDQAFPVAMPYATNPMLWRRDMVEAWLAEQGRPKHLPPAPRPSGPNVLLMEEARRA